MTATSPFIIDGDSPQNAATLCVVEGKVEDYEGLRKHFGRYLLAFFPDATGALRTQADLQEWLETPNTGAGILRVPPVSRIFSTPVVDAPPSPPVSVSTRSRQSRAVKPKSHVSCASSAALPPQTGCWCSDLCSNIIGALPDEMSQRRPQELPSCHRLRAHS